MSCWFCLCWAAESRTAKIAAASKWNWSCASMLLFSIRHVRKRDVCLICLCSRFFLKKCRLTKRRWCSLRYKVSRECVFLLGFSCGLLFVFFLNVFCQLHHSYKSTRAWAWRPQICESWGLRTDLGGKTHLPPWGVRLSDVVPKNHSSAWLLWYLKWKLHLRSSHLQFYFEGCNL